ncbi:MAG: hypothetical protein LQ338_001209 [Usnochroma carphineum]|nr:MAG: hypothetical protein LQ338_001209 [Usnochroma carphineum]
MSGKGIADLRAKFENRTNDTSPPSRGRSPVGQENVTGSGKRKIRASFISVERSGQMGSSEGQREFSGSNGEQKPTTNGGHGTKAEVNGDAVGFSPTTGLAIASGVAWEGQGPGDQSDGRTTSKAGNGSLTPEEAARKDAINPDEPATADEENVSPMQPSGPKDRYAVSGGAALVPQRESLGELLKGSEFEPEQEMSSKSASPKKPTPSSNPSTPNKTRTPKKSTPGQPKAASTPKINGSPRLKSGTSRPSPLENSGKASAAEPAEKPAPDRENSPIPRKTPISPAATKTPTKQPPEKTASPKQTVEPNNTTQAPGGDRKKAVTSRNSPRPSPGAKPAHPPASKLSKPASSVASNLPKSPKVTSPSTTKPRPKSPTRPVRLPGAATASTAASAAKTGNTAPSEPSSRASLSGPKRSSTLNKPTATKAPPKVAQPNASGPRNRAPRSSLRVSTADPKPKPRTSTASTKAADGDFLARMMRPTQSSASKTHEKVEQKTPPKKRVSSRPSRISDKPSKPAESKPTQAEPAQEQETPVQETALSKQQPKVQQNGELNHENPTADLTDAAQQKTQESSDEEAPEPSIAEAGSQAAEPVSAS